MLPEPMEFSFDYAPAGDFKVLSGIRMKGPMGMSFTYRYTDLTANGKKVELPAAAGKTATPPVEKKPDPTVPPAGEKGEKEDDGM